MAMRAVQTRRVSLAGLVALSATGCMGWRVQQVSPRELLRDKSIEAVRVTRADKSRVEIWSPRIEGDSIVGHPTDRAIARLVMPLSQVETISTRYKSVGKTLVVGLAVIGAVAVYALLQSLNQGGF
jgi:hypothetical protein